jgi:hypothetical protein
LVEHKEGQSIWRAGRKEAGDRPDEVKKILFT